MAETDIATMTFELLKRMQGQLNRMEADIGDVKLRMSAIEHQFAQQSLQIAGLNGRMDRFDERLSRVERRLDLAEA